MAENKKSFMLYTDLIHTVKKMKKAHAGELLMTILEYVNDLNPTVENPIVDLVFEPIKQQLKRDLKKWEAKSVKNSESAKKRWGEKVPNDANAYERTKRIAKHADIDTVNDNDTVTDIKIINKKEEIFSNFFYIGIEMYKSPISSYIKNEMQIFIDAWKVGKTLTVEQVLTQMDSDCIGKQFNNEEHIRNTFNLTYKNMLNPKKEYGKSPSPQTTKGTFKINEIGNKLKE